MTKIGAEPVGAGWVENPPDRSGVVIEILPPAFDTKSSGCVLCGHTLDIGWECTACNADHFSAVRRLLRARGEK